jgi:N utilization substance protein B
MQTDKRGGRGKKKPAANAYRTAARKIAVQMMYMAEMTEGEPRETADIFLRSTEKEIEEKTFAFAQELFFGAYAITASSDATVARLLRTDWTMDRLSCTVMQIFRLAVYELTETDTPSFAILKDYVNLAGAFDDEKTAVFVNGLLEKVKSDIIKRRDGNAGC